MVGAMLILITKTELLELDALISETAHGNAEINLIQVSAKLAGNVIKPRDNVFLQKKVKVSEATLPVLNIVSHLHLIQTYTDVILQAILVINVMKLVLKDAAREKKLVRTAKTQIHQDFSNAIELIWPIQSAKNVLEQVKKDAHQEQKLATVVLHQQSFSLVTRKISHASKQTLDKSNKHVMLNVATILQPTCWETGEDSWSKMA